MKVLENPLNKPEKNTCVNTDILSLSLEYYILVDYFVYFGGRGLTHVHGMQVEGRGKLA